MIARLLATLRDRDGGWQRFGAPALAFVVCLAGAEILRSYAQRAADDWTDMRERADKLVRLYADANDSYWHVRAAVEAQQSTSDVLPVPDFETAERPFEALKKMAIGDPDEAEVPS